MIKNILIVAVLGLLLFLLSKSSNYSGSIVIKHDTLWRDTTIVRWHKGKNIPYKVIDTQWIDTSKVVHDSLLFCKELRVYSDTFRIDSSFVTLKDTIRGEILGRGFYANVKEKTIYITKTINTPEKGGFLFGGNINTRLTTFDAGVGIGYQIPKKGIIILGVGTNGYNLSFYKKF